MTRTDIFDKVVAVAKEYMGDDIALTENTSIQDGFVDSVQLMEFIISLEDAFDIEINDTDADHFTQLKDVVDYILLKKES
ncbi:phosphopantetheine-binding protein [Streptococcus moroccensis]|uniref:Acyl carrier protein n=1 Tax=Streptococcus moroccensis TaxID=1451356 RepID=A0ABT9YQ33_9STRE|nr:phosphopantetheine-binding protein [Streptococcus moroccensis]MDQ0222102.1 acyl carrier protein [Streptococcus moroccensis]